MVTPKDSKGVTKELVSQVSAQFKKIGCRCTCVSDEELKPTCVDCVNRFAQLQVDQADNVCIHMDSVDVNIGVNVLGHRFQALEAIKERESCE